MVVTSVDGPANYTTLNLIWICLNVRTRQETVGGRGGEQGLLCRDGPDCINVTFEHVHHYSRASGWRHVLVPSGIKESHNLYDFIACTDNKYNLAFLYFSKLNITLFIRSRCYQFRPESEFILLKYIPCLCIPICKSVLKIWIKRLIITRIGMNV